MVALMPEPAEELPAREKSGDNSAARREDGMPVGTPFPPGRSGNPRGRPKGLARRIREEVGEDSLTYFWQAAQAGWMVYRNPETEEVTYERVEPRDRIAVSKIIAERGWGKPVEYVPIEDDDPLDLAERAASAIAVDFDAALDELAARRQARDQTG